MLNDYKCLLVSNKNTCLCCAPVACTNIWIVHKVLALIKKIKSGKNEEQCTSISSLHELVNRASIPNIVEFLTALAEDDLQASVVALAEDDLEHQASVVGVLLQHIRHADSTLVEHVSELLQMILVSTENMRTAVKGGITDLLFGLITSPSSSKVIQKYTPLLVLHWASSTSRDNQLQLITSGYLDKLIESGNSDIATAVAQLESSFPGIIMMECSKVKFHDFVQSVVLLRLNSLDSSLLISELQCTIVLHYQIYKYVPTNYKS